MDHVMDVNSGNVHLDEIRNLEWQGLNGHRALQRREDSAIGDARGLAGKLERNFDANRSVKIDFVKIRVQDFHRDRRALQIFQDDVLAVEFRGARFELDDSRVRGGGNSRLQLETIDRERSRRRRGPVQNRWDASLAPERLVLALGTRRAFLAG